jgi:hypothetical protein
MRGRIQAKARNILGIMCLATPVVCDIPRRSRERIASGVLAGGLAF